MKKYAVVLLLLLSSFFVFSQEQEEESAVPVESEVFVSTENTADEPEYVGILATDELPVIKSEAEIVLKEDVTPVAAENVEPVVAESKNNYAVGIAFSFLGVEPIFQIRKDNLEIQPGISFMTLGFGTEGATGLIIPKVDIGYCVNFQNIGLSVSTGLTDFLFFGIPLGSSAMAPIADVLSVYVKAAERIGNFEISLKVYYPLFGFGYDFRAKEFMHEYLAGSWVAPLAGFVCTTIEGKVIIK